MGRGEQGEMGCQGDLLASMAPGFLSQPNQGRSAFICFISMIYLRPCLKECNTAEKWWDKGKKKKQNPWAVPTNIKPQIFMRTNEYIRPHTLSISRDCSWLHPNTYADEFQSDTGLLPHSSYLNFYQRGSGTA